MSIRHASAEDTSSHGEARLVRLPRGLSTLVAEPPRCWERPHGAGAGRFQLRGNPSPTLAGNPQGGTSSLPSSRRADPRRLETAARQALSTGKYQP
jgi:hypothetical protein